ncbi:secreted RxLR effector protein 161-like [Nicotiana tabacum]|uniref:Secreted RxLR effector protein 161-like n=1 Tax=Nicotiana tabacum TaxID=4097 RepID=A0AC58SE78_TOBAC
MKSVPYASAVGSLMYAMLCTRPDICFVVGIVSKFQFNPGREHWTAVKHIIKYLKRTRDYILVYHSDDLVPIGYTDSDFQSDRDSRKSTLGNVFTMGSRAISWRRIKQTCVADSTMEAEYVAASEAAKEAMFKGNKKITTAAMEMTEMRALIEKLFGELNARLEKFDQTIQEMKESLQGDSIKAAA